MTDILQRLFPMARLAKANLFRARSRTLLAIVGIAIGVMAIGTLGVFGSAFGTAQLQDVSTSTQSVYVVPGEDAESPHLTSRDRLRIESNIPDNAELFGVKTTSGRLSVRDSTQTVTVKSVPDAGSRLDIKEGSIPTDWRKGVVVGGSIADKHDIQPGDRITVDGEKRQVHAVLESSRSGFLQTSEAVLVPHGSLPRDEYSGFLIRANSPDQAVTIAEDLRETLNDRGDKYRVADAGEAVDQFQQMMAQINLFLLGIGAVSLFVAAISILNIMLMSVIERKSEIGTLRAVGYSKRDVLKLVLTEAALLGVVGATVGAALTLLLGLGINQLFLGDPLAFTGRGIFQTAVGAAFGFAVSLVSGAYPAWKAATANPVEAIRN